MKLLKQKNRGPRLSVFLLVAGCPCNHALNVLPQGLGGVGGDHELDLSPCGPIQMILLTTSLFNLFSEAQTCVGASIETIPMKISPKTRTCQLHQKTLKN